MPTFREVSRVLDEIFGRIVINLGWSGWIVGGVKVWAQVACMVDPQVFMVM